MSDVWEAAYAATNTSPAEDDDQDGQSNLQEATAGTDPFSSASVFRVLTGPLLEDSQLLRFTSVLGREYVVETIAPNGTQWVAQPTVYSGTGEEVLAAVPPATPPWAQFRIRPAAMPTAIEAALPYLGTLDTDLDGESDLAEFWAGTNPFQSGSVLSVTSSYVGRSLLLSWPSVTAKLYQVQASLDPSGPWSNVGSPAVGSGATVTVAVEPSGTSAFFRVGVSDLDSDGDNVSEWELSVASLPSLRDARGPLAQPPCEAIQAMLRATNIVSVEPIAPVANATMGEQGRVVFLRSGNLNPVTLRFTVSGTAIPGADYLALSGTAVMAAGSRAVEVPIQPLKATGLFPARSVIVTLQSTPNYTIGTNSTATVNLVSEAALSVKDFGALGDGIADDTLAIRSAIGALESSTNYNTLYFPAGTYRLNSYQTFSGPSGSWLEFLHFGTSDLSGRDLFFRGDEGACLYSTVSTSRVRMLMVKATFRSLSFRGLTWKKEPRMLPETAWEPNGAEAVWLKDAGCRRVETVRFQNCTFNNCHGAVAAYGDGYDVRGMLGRLEVRDCNVLNPYGPNSTNSHKAYGGGQQIRMNGWIRYAIYSNNYFDGGSDTPDPAYNPYGGVKDGSHFGSPLNLFFTNNIVRRMGVEAVFQTDDPLMGTTAAPFVIPPADGTTPVSVVLVPMPTTYKPGQTLNVRTWFTPTAEATNVLLRVIAYNGNTATLTLVNDGLTPNVVGRTVPVGNGGQPIYLQDYNPTYGTIAHNAIYGGPGAADIGISADAKVHVADNFITGYRHGMYAYHNVRNILSPPTPGSLIESNVVFTWNTTTRGTGDGIRASGPGQIISRNLIVTPYSSAFRGVVAGGTNCWVEANTVVPVNVVRQPYASYLRSVGIAFMSGSRMNTAVANNTYGMDVGVGPETPGQTPSYWVISHYSTNDVLGIDPSAFIPSQPDVFWSFDEPEAPWRDSIGTNHFTPVGSRILSMPGKLQGCVSNSASYSDYMTVPHSLELSFSGPFTIGGWFSFAMGTSLDATCLAKGSQFRLYYAGTGINRYRFAVNGAYVQDSTSLTPSAWHFVVAWFDGTNAFIQVNNGNVSIATTGAPVPSTSPLIALKKSGEPGGLACDEVFLYNRVLTPQERGTLFSSAISTANHSFDFQVVETLPQRSEFSLRRLLDAGRGE